MIRYNGDSFSGSQSNSPVLFRGTHYYDVTTMTTQQRPKERAAGALRNAAPEVQLQAMERGSLSVPGQKLGTHG